MAVKKLKTVLRFEFRNWVTGTWIELEVPYTKHNWDWVVAHPDTRFIRKTTEYAKPIATFIVGE